VAGNRKLVQGGGADLVLVDQAARMEDLVLAQAKAEVCPLMVAAARSASY
jgi:hypothetical protein